MIKNKDGTHNEDETGELSHNRNINLGQIRNNTLTNSKGLGRSEEKIGNNYSGSKELDKIK